MILSMPGEEFDPFESGEEESEDAIRAVLFRSVEGTYKYSNRNHVNRAIIQTGQSEQNMLYYTIGALFLGLLFGFFARFILPGTVTDGICHYVLDPVSTIFMDLLKIIIAPIVYLSIVTCFSQYKNIGELGRIGIKTMGMYLMTTMIAIILGISLFSIFKPESWAFALSGDVAVSGISVDTGGAAPSLLDTIVNIVPSNFLKPFVDSNTLQLIFLAVVSGIAVGKIGDFSAVLRELLTSFILSSSSAAMPTNLRICSEKLGISPKVCNFTIPFGATINMDGNCIFYAVMGLFLARAYGVNMPMSSMLSFAVTIALLSLATPGVAGAGIIMLATVLKSIDVPVEGIGLLMGIYSLLGMIQTMCNTTGDVAVSLIVAKNEKLVDENVFRS